MPENGKPKFVIVGSGVVGLTTAYWLNRATSKYEIHVIDQHKTVAQGASYQNGGVINVESIFPVASYMSLGKTMKSSLMHSLYGTPANTCVTYRALMEPGIFSWVWHFYSNSSEEAIKTSSNTMLRIGTMSGSLFQDAVSHLKLDKRAHNFNQTPGLCLSHTADPESLATTKRANFDDVHAKQYVTDEKELEAISSDSGLLNLKAQGYNFATVEPYNLTINTMSFCRSLRSHLEKNGVIFHMGTVVKDINSGPSASKSKAVSELVLGDSNGKESRLNVDAVVLAAGFETSYLLRSMWLTAPLVAVKAYSAHIRNAKIAPKLKYAAHLEAKTACLITPYSDDEPCSVRVTGIRDMDGFNHEVREDRLSDLLDCAKLFVGEDLDIEKDVDTWAGVMAVSPDDFPIIGRVGGYDNLYINTGHGFRGTNYSLPSALLLVRAVLGEDFMCPEAVKRGDVEYLGERVSPARFGL